MIKVESGIRNFVPQAWHTGQRPRRGGVHYLVGAMGGTTGNSSGGGVVAEARTDATADTPAQAPPEAAAGFGDRTLLLIGAAVTLPLVWMGYGTDIDVPDVLASAETIREGDYIPSRPPGVPVFEAITAVLDPVGGHVLVNLATAAAGALTVVGIARLVRAWGHRNGDLIALAFLASPMTLISATSTGDFIWAVGFLVWATLWLVRGHPVAAGVLFALAVGTRLSSIFLVVALLVADGWDREHRPGAARALAVTVPLSVLLYVPAWFAYGRTSQILETAEGWRSFGNNLGRFALKNYASAGIVLLAVVAVASPALVRALRRFGDDPMLRAGVLGFAVSQALFLVLPWKYNHLLPALLMLLLWLGASARNRRSFLWLTVAAVALNGIVTFRPLTPDSASEAQAGHWDPAVTAGLLVNDVRCRLDAMHDDPPPLNRVAWACTLVPLRGEQVDPVDPKDDLTLRERYG